MSEAWAYGPKEGTVKKALLVAALRGVRTLIQALAGVAALMPAVYSVAEAKVAALAAMWSAIGAAIAGVAAFLQNLAEELEKMESAA